MDQDARTNVLQRVPVYRGLDEAALAVVAQQAHERPLPKGDALFEQGEVVERGSTVRAHGALPSDRAECHQGDWRSD